MEYLLNQLVNGICQGSIYALMAIGYSVIVGVVGMEMAGLSVTLFKLDAELEALLRAPASTPFYTNENI